MPDRREKETRKVFSTPFFFVLSKSNSSSKSARSLNSCILKHRFFSSFCASSFFFLLARSIHSSHFSLVARARACIYISSSFTRETRREKEREGKKTTCTRDDDPGGKREEEEERSNRFFGAVVCVRASEDERKRERKQDFPLLFKRFSKGALRAEFSLSLSLSLPLVRSVCDSSSSAYTTHKHAPKRKQNAFFCFFREGGEVIEKKKSKKKKKNKNKNNKR